MSNARYYPQHDRTSCSDAHPVNATAEGSTGCARCTAILLDQREELFDALQELLAAHKGKKPLGAALDKADAAIAKITKEQPHDR